MHNVFSTRPPARTRSAWRSSLGPLAGGARPAASFLPRSCKSTTLSSSSAHLLACQLPAELCGLLPCRRGSAIALWANLMRNRNQHQSQHQSLKHQFLLVTSNGRAPQTPAQTPAAPCSTPRIMRTQDALRPTRGCAAGSPPPTPFPARTAPRARPGSDETR